MLFAITVSTDFGNPLLTRYVQADQTLGDNPVWQSYTTWVVLPDLSFGLLPDTTYYVSCLKQGFYPNRIRSVRQSGYAPSSISFSVRTVAQSSSLRSLWVWVLTPGSVLPPLIRVKLRFHQRQFGSLGLYLWPIPASSSSQGKFIIDSVLPSGQDLSLRLKVMASGTGVSKVSGNMVIEPYDGPMILSDRSIPISASFTTDDAPVDTGVGRFEIRRKLRLSFTRRRLHRYSDHYCRLC
jgi:hypothetical protein